MNGELLLYTILYVLDTLSYITPLYALVKI